MCIFLLHAFWWTRGSIPCQRNGRKKKKKERHVFSFETCIRGLSPTSEEWKNEATNDGIVWMFACAGNKRSLNTCQRNGRKKKKKERHVFSFETCIRGLSPTSEEWKNEATNDGIVWMFACAGNKRSLNTCRGFLGMW